MSDAVELKVRVDRETRDRFSEVAKSLGMTASTAVNVFMRQFVQRGGFPFDVVRPEGYVPTEREFAAEMDRRWQRMQAVHCEQHDLIEV